MFTKENKISSNTLLPGQGGGGLFGGSGRGLDNGEGCEKLLVFRESTGGGPSGGGGAWFCLCSHLKGGRV